MLAYLGFPVAHSRQTWTANSLQRLHKEVKRRTNVFGIFLTPAAVMQLVGALLTEQHGEWGVERRYFSAGSMTLLRREEELPLALAAD